MAFVIGVDVGGTNTDTVILRGNKVVEKAKSPTTEEKTRGVISSIQAALDGLSADTRSQVLNQLARVTIGTTHFTNAVKKRDGKSLDRVAVIRLCGPASQALPPYADFPTELEDLVYGGVYMIGGGLEYNTQEISPVNPEEVRGTVKEILNRNPAVRNVVISGVFSPCDEPNGRQEKEVERIVKEECPQFSCTLSHELGMLGLIERENAAILNESLKTLARTTISAFQEALSKLNIRCPFYLTQNDGTMISAEEAMQCPVLTFSSGPTNSMRGAAFLSGLTNAIVVDIGGTTLDVGVLRNGFPQEASTHIKVGGVRTNFCMPDVQSIPLGGGTLVEWNADKGVVKVGPNSVEYCIKEEALCFGGRTCTTTDIALAAGVAPASICQVPEALSALDSKLVYTAMREIRKKVEAAIDVMKTEKEDVPVLLVGGGSILVDCTIPLKGASRVILPKDHWDVANAVGAALGTVGGSSDLVVNLEPIKAQLKESKENEGCEEAELEKKAREVALNRGRDAARDEAIVKKGAVADTVYIHSEEISNITYVANRVRVKVKAIGAFTTQDVAGLSKTVKEEVAAEEEKMETEFCLDVDLSKVLKEQMALDNPNWPNSSAEERAKDEAANLPPPQLTQDGSGQASGSEWVLSEHDIECLAVGAGILGCGGGGDPNNGMLRAVKMVRQGKVVKILNPCRLDASKMGVVCGVGFMGAPVILIEKLVGGEETMLAFQRLQQLMASGVMTEGDGRKGNESVRVQEKKCDYFDGTSFPMYIADPEDLEKVSLENVPLNQRITGLTCLEAGGCNSVEPLLVSAQTGLPVLDVDGMGRAFPELQMYIPFIYDSAHCPSTLADCKGESITCTHVESPVELEKFFRVETVRMGMAAALAMGVMDYNTVLKKMVLFTMSRAWQLGRAVQRAKVTHSNVIQSIVEDREGMVLVIGKVVSVDRENSAGFTKVISIIEGLDSYAGYYVKVQAKNENYIAQTVDAKGKELEKLACTPDLISIVDSNTGDPITTEQIRYGLRVGVVILPANPLLKTPKALKVVGPRAFGFDMEYFEPRPLHKDEGSTTLNF